MRSEGRISERRRAQRVNALSGSLLEAVSAPSRVVMRQSIEWVHVTAGQRLATDASDPAWAVLVDGHVRVCRQRPNGVARVSWRVQPSACVPLAVDAEDDERWVEIVTPAELAVLNRHVMTRLSASDPSVALALAAEARRLVGDLEEELLRRAEGSLYERLARELMGDPHDDDGLRPPAISLSHGAMAELVGSSREAVTRALNRLARDGLVSLGRKKIDVLDSARLAEIGQITWPTAKR
jgi:CRP-like cAMP-binding protein